MRSVVACESWFGNTQQIARAIAEELARHGEARLLSVTDDLGPTDEIDLLVVGAPTHVHGMSSAMSRRSAIEQRDREADGTDGHDEPGPGIRDWLKTLPKTENGGRAAAFDTRIEKSVVLVGSAGKGIGKRLRKHGFDLVSPPESFFVLDAAGPLKDGELERAADWARELATSVERSAGASSPHVAAA